MTSLRGGGNAGDLVRSIDWATTPLGPTGGWPNSLKTTINRVLHSQHPMFLWWGPELIQSYNDAYTPSIGFGKHPSAMGQRGRDCWGEIWPTTRSHSRLTRPRSRLGHASLAGEFQGVESRAGFKARMPA